jgi:hypothetical protein
MRNTESSLLPPAAPERFYMSAADTAKMARFASPQSRVHVGLALREAQHPTPAAPRCAIVSAFEREQHWRSQGELAIRIEMERRVTARLGRGRGLSR